MVDADGSVLVDGFTVSIWTGVLAGIATSILIALARRFWIGLIKPSIEDILYRDAKIEGRWKAQFSAASVDPDRVHRIIAATRKNEQDKLLKAVKAVAETEKARKIEAQVETNNEAGENKDKDKDKDKVEKPKIRIQRSSSEQKSEWENTFSVTLARKGHVVTGTMLGTTGGNEGRNYTLNGSFRNLILTGTYESTDRTEIERGCFSLMLKNNGSCLYGYMIAYSDSDHDLGAIKTTWSRHRQGS